MSVPYTDLRKDISEAIEKGLLTAAAMDASMEDAIDLATANVMRRISKEGEKREKPLTKENMMDLISGIFKVGR